MSSQFQAHECPKKYVFGPVAMKRMSISWDAEEDMLSTTSLRSLSFLVLMHLTTTCCCL